MIRQHFCNFLSMDITIESVETSLLSFPS